MGKELESLSRIMETYGKNNSLEGTYDDFLTIKKALQRLETIDNTDPSEALECLERIYANVDTDADYYFVEAREDYKTIEQALLNAQENIRSEEILQKYYQEGITLDSVRTLKQERDNYKKVLSLINEKNVDIVELKRAKTVEDYNLQLCGGISDPLNEEEFDLLKRYTNER